jgi:hypothetical protein
MAADAVIASRAASEAAQTEMPPRRLGVPQQHQPGTTRPVPGRGGPLTGKAAIIYTDSTIDTWTSNGVTNELPEIVLAFEQ